MILTGLVRSSMKISSGDWRSISFPSGAATVASGYTFAGWYTNLVSAHANDWEQGSIAAATGANASYTTRIRLKDYMAATASTTYTFNLNNSSGAKLFYVYYYNSSKTFISSQEMSKTQGNFTTPANTAYIRFTLRVDDSTTLVATDINSANFSVIKSGQSPVSTSISYTISSLAADTHLVATAYKVAIAANATENCYTYKGTAQSSAGIIGYAFMP